MHSLSLLELPSEALKEIFLRSDNASFIFFIDQKLHNLIYDFSVVRRHLIQVCCHDPHLSDEHPNVAHRALRQLLKQDWLTLGRILEAAYDWFNEILEHEICESLKLQGLPDELSSGILAHVRGSLQTRRHQPRPTEELRGTNWYVNSLIVDLGTHLCYYEVDYTIFLFAVYTQGQFRSHFRSRRDYLKSRRILHFIPPLRNRKLFPPRIVSGPWTQRDGDLLTFFMAHFMSRKSARTISGNAPEQRTALAAGLQRALDERNMPALATLGGEMREAFDSRNTESNGFISLSTELLRPRSDINVNRGPWNRINTPMMRSHICMVSEYKWPNNQLAWLLEWATSSNDVEVGQILALYALRLMRMRSGYWELWEDPLARGFATVAYGEDEDDWWYNRAFEDQDEWNAHWENHQAYPMMTWDRARHQLRLRAEVALDAMDHRYGPKRNMMRGKSSELYFDDADRIDKYWCDYCNFCHP